MARRLTVSGSRAEMGDFLDTYEPESPPPVWTPPKQDFWRKPSKWQICMPRLRLMAKILVSFLGFVLLFLIVAQKPLPPPRPASPPEPPAPVKPPPPSPESKPSPEQTEAGQIGIPETDDWVWKSFPQHNGLTRGVSHLVTCEPGKTHCAGGIPKLIPYRGYKNFQEGVSRIVSCIGPRGLLLNESKEDAVWAYPGKAIGAADPALGSYEAAGLDGSVSFDRIGRFQAYGLNQFYTLEPEDLSQSSDVDWDSVRWGDLQDNCAASNKHRFKPTAERPLNSILNSNSRHKQRKSSPKLSDSRLANKTRRTAILIRVWTGAKWTADAVMNIRAMVAEASLASGGKYQVFILLHVKDDRIPLFVGEDEPQATLTRNVPPEFHSMTEVWNDAQVRGLYSGLAEHAFVSRSPWMIVQWFARNRPDFDFFYHWEFDVRYTGHYLDLFEGLDRFGKAQPRRGIWERAGRVYIPSVHGDFNTDYRNSTRREDPHHVWGPVPVEGVRPRGPHPPVKEFEDDYEWGVGEHADWIGFLPSFNVTGTGWWFRDFLWGYAQGISTPRRATLIAQGRVSRRVLEIMNYENSENGHHVDAEMFPQTMCLHHGLKSTTYPHPIFADRYWTPESLQQTFNGGPFGQAGGYEKSTFSKWNEFAWTNMTWYYSSAQAMPIFQRFLGVAALEIGGSEWESVYGRTVVRPMLLHPVKGGKSWQWTNEGWLQTQTGK